VTRAERLQREAEAASREARGLAVALDTLTPLERRLVRRAARQFRRQQVWCTTHAWEKFPEQLGGDVLDDFTRGDVRLWARLADLALDLARCPRRIFSAAHRAHLSAAMRRA
jgi:hypothetical protein